MRAREALGHLGLGHASSKPVGGDGGDGRVDAADEVGAAGGGVLVGRLVQALDGELDGVVARHALGPAQLDVVRASRPPEPVGVEVGLLVAAAGDVVGEDAAALRRGS